MNVMKTKFTILFTVALLFTAIATQAQGPFVRDHRDIRYDRMEIRHDRRDLRFDRHDLRFDRHDRRCW